MIMKEKFFNKSLKILLFTNGLILVAGAMLAPIYALFVEEIGGNLLDASIIGGLFALAAGLTTLFVGRFVDTQKREELIVVLGYSMMGVGFLLYSVANSVLFLSLVSILIGFSEAIYAPAFDVLYTQHLDPKKAGKQWGAWESMNYFSIAFGAFIGGLIASSFGFKPLFIAMAILAFSSVIYILLVPKRVFYR